jgi:hypothetical protein
MPRSALPALASLSIFAIFVGIVALNRAVAATNFLRWRFDEGVSERSEERVCPCQLQRRDPPDTSRVIVIEEDTVQ